MRTQALEILKRLIAFETVSSESNLALIDYVRELLASKGIESLIVKDESGRKANLFASTGPRDVPGILLSGHTDVVPAAGQAWTLPAFQATVRDGRIYGRGSCDMKGFIAAVLAKLDRLVEVSATVPIHFAFTHDEEIGCLGARNLVGLLRGREDLPRLALIGEPTSMRVMEGHKGCCEYTATFHGTDGHGSAPEQGVNAVDFATRYALRLMELREDLKRRAPAGSLYDPSYSTINIGGIHGGSAHNVIASKARVEWETRPVVAEDFAFVMREIDAYTDDVLRPAMQAIAPQADIEVEVIGEALGLEPREMNAARDLVFRLTGANHTGVVPFATEGGLFQDLGLDVVVCGPGSIEQAHRADEYVSLEQMAACLGLLDRLPEVLRDRG